MDGTIREGYPWNPSDAGHAMVAVAKLVLDGTPIVDGVEIPGLGKAVVDECMQIKVKKIMIVNKDTIDGLIKQGLDCCANFELKHTGAGPRRVQASASSTADGRALGHYPRQDDGGESHDANGVG